MLKVGLTGSIAVGKSYAAEVFAEKGCFVLDADRTAREVVEPGTVGWRKIVENFGEAILHTDKTINRAKLGTIVFSDERQREILNEIVHPLVRQSQSEWMNRITAANPDAIVIIDAALMIESGGYRRFDKIIVVWCEPEMQMARLMKRNNLDRAAAASRIAAQMPQTEKKKIADFLIDSSAGFADTRRQIEAIYEQLHHLANQR